MFLIISIVSMLFIFMVNSNKLFLFFLLISIISLSFFLYFLYNPVYEELPISKIEHFKPKENDKLILLVKLKNENEIQETFTDANIVNNFENFKVKVIKKNIKFLYSETKVVFEKKINLVYKMR